ncbi:MAG: hypothetical protein IT546_16730 [Caulobacteraceae bacterium]|nr:hypothetical protein [Caulobacteraceae bacterium]
MGQIDVGRAATAGFGVIARNPLAVLVWGLVFFALTILPLILTYGAIGPAFAEFIQNTPSDGGEPDLSAVMRLQGQMMAANALTQLGQMAAQVLLMCAIFRAVLRPQDSSLFYLRLGKGELMAGLMLLFIGVLVFMGVFGAVLIGAIVVAGAAAASTETAVVLGIVGVLALIVGGVWLALRLSLAPVMSFAQQGFPLVEAWKLTQGKVGSLFLVGLLMVLIVVTLEMVVFGALIGGAIAAIAGASLNEAALQAFFAQPVSAWSMQILPWVLGGGLVISLLGGVFTTLASAPWAAAYRDLAPPTDDETAATFA